VSVRFSLVNRTAAAKTCVPSLMTKAKTALAAMPGAARQNHANGILHAVQPSVHRPPLSSSNGMPENSEYGDQAPQRATPAWCVTNARKQIMHGRGYGPAAWMDRAISDVDFRTRKPRLMSPRLCSGEPPARREVGRIGQQRQLCRRRAQLW